MAEENTMDRGGKIWEFLGSQVLDDDGLYDFDQMNNDEKWTWWEANKDKFADKPGFSSVINESKTKDWKTELAKYDDKLLTDEVLEELAEDNNLNVEDLKRYREDNKRAKEYSEGRARREKEIKDAGVFSPWTLASDYSKQRYIDNPDNSIFGKEGKFNPYSTEGQEELSDLAFGAFGAAGDLVPGIGGVVIGPAMRTGRDITHKVNGSKYQKDWGDIGGDFLTDLGFNVGTNYAPTAILSQIKKRGGNASKEFENLSKSIGNIRERMAVDDEMKAIHQGLDKFNDVNIPNTTQVIVYELMKALKERGEQLPKAKRDELARYWSEIPDEKLDITSESVKEIADKLGSQRKATNWVKSLPDSPFKNDMMGFVGGKEWRPTEMAKRITEWYKSMGSDANVYANKYTSRTARAMPDPVFYAAKKRADAPKLTNLEKAGEKVARNWQSVGGALVKEAATGDVGPFGRKTSTPKESVSKKHERWSNGFATFDEMKTDEYKQWKADVTRQMMLGLSAND